MKILDSEDVLEYVPSKSCFSIQNYSNVEIDGETKTVVGFYGFFVSEENFDEFYKNIKNQFNNLRNNGDLWSGYEQDIRNKKALKKYKMWGIKVRGKHNIFMAFDKSHHAKEKCKQLFDMGIVCKMVKVVVENDE